MSKEKFAELFMEGLKAIAPDSLSMQLIDVDIEVREQVSTEPDFHIAYVIEYHPNGTITIHDRYEDS